MAYSNDTNTKVLTFLNLAQTKIGEVSTFIAKKVSKNAPRDTYQNEADLAFFLDCFVRALDNTFNNWTEQEVVRCLEQWNAIAKLNLLPYFSHEQYNLNIVFGETVEPTVATEGEFLNGIRTSSSGSFFKFARIDIGAWNMNVVNSNKTVLFPGITNAVVLAVVIFADYIPETNQINLDYASFGSPGTRAGGWQVNAGIAVELFSGSDFQDAGHSSVLVNRGYVYIMYPAA